jgi:hypothetical protein
MNVEDMWCDVMGFVRLVRDEVLGGLYKEDYELNV